MVYPGMTNGEIREGVLSIARALTTHVNIVIASTVNVVENTMTSRLRDFVRMNPPIFFGTNVGKDPREFLYEVHN